MNWERANKLETARRNDYTYPSMEQRRKAPHSIPKNDQVICAKITRGDVAHAMADHIITYQSLKAVVPGLDPRWWHWFCTAMWTMSYGWMVSGPDGISVLRVATKAEYAAQGARH